MALGKSESCGIAFSWFRLLSLAVGAALLAFSLHSASASSELAALRIEVPQGLVRYETALSLKWVSGPQLIQAGPTATLLSGAIALQVDPLRLEKLRGQVRSGETVTDAQVVPLQIKVWRHHCGLEQAGATVAGFDRIDVTAMLPVECGTVDPLTIELEVLFEWMEIVDLPTLSMDLEWSALSRRLFERSASGEIDAAILLRVVEDAVSAQEVKFGSAIESVVQRRAVIDYLTSLVGKRLLQVELTEVSGAPIETRYRLDTEAVAQGSEHYELGGTAQVYRRMLASAKLVEGG